MAKNNKKLNSEKATSWHVMTPTWKSANKEGAKFADHGRSEKRLGANCNLHWGSNSTQSWTNSSQTPSKQWVPPPPPPCTPELVSSALQLCTATLLAKRSQSYTKWRPCWILCWKSSMRATERAKNEQRENARRGGIWQATQRSTVLWLERKREGMEWRGGGVLPGIKKRVRAGRDNCCGAFAGTF